MVGNDPERSTHDPFSVGLRTQLSARYPEVLSEPLPGEIQRLALELERKLAAEVQPAGPRPVRLGEPREQTGTWTGEPMRYERKTV